MRRYVLVTAISAQQTMMIYVEVWHGEMHTVLSPTDWGTATPPPHTHTQARTPSCEVQRFFQANHL